MVDAGSLEVMDRGGDWTKHRLLLGLNLASNG